MTARKLNALELRVHQAALGNPEKVIENRVICFWEPYMVHVDHNSEGTGCPCP
jgi:hypothetical protein